MAKKPTTEVVDWQKEMEAQAKIASEMQRSAGGGGKFFSVKAGQLSYDDVAMPGNQAAVVVLADIIENCFYDAAYDPNTPASPKCFAFAHSEAELEPHEAVDNDPYFERQHATCNGCPQNEWGSARQGRGKACSNVMRLALIPAGAYTKGAGRNAGLTYEQFDEEEHFAKADIAYLKVSVMSVKNYSQYVKGLANEMKLPPHGVFTNIEVVPDAKSQHKITFEVIGPVPHELLGTIMKRHRSAMDGINFPYTPPIEREDTTPRKANAKLGGRGRR
jgi:hypothetical protein